MCTKISLEIWYSWARHGEKYLNFSKISQPNCPNNESTTTLVIGWGECYGKYRYPNTLRDNFLFYSMFKGFYMQSLITEKNNKVNKMILTNLSYTQSLNWSETKEELEKQQKQPREKHLGLRKSLEYLSLEILRKSLEYLYTYVNV